MSNSDSDHESSKDSHEVIHKTEPDHPLRKGKFIKTIKQNAIYLKPRRQTIEEMMDDSLGGAAPNIQV